MVKGMSAQSAVVPAGVMLAEGFGLIVTFAVTKLSQPAALV
jgi:hypothetical protein